MNDENVQQDFPVCFLRDHESISQWVDEIDKIAAENIKLVLEKKRQFDDVRLGNWKKIQAYLLEKNLVPANMLAEQEKIWADGWAEMQKVGQNGRYRTQGGVLYLDRTPDNCPDCDDEDAAAALAQKIKAALQKVGINPV